jgi:hypothetical protein
MIFPASQNGIEINRLRAWDITNQTVGSQEIPQRPRSSANETAEWKLGRESRMCKTLCSSEILVQDFVDGIR